MPLIKESEIDWPKINQLKQEREERLSNPTWEAKDEAEMPFEGSQYLTLLPIEKMTPLEVEKWKRMVKLGMVSADQTLKLDPSPN